MSLTIKEKFVRGSIWVALGNWCVQAFSLLIFVLLARVLTPEDIGLMAIVSIFIAIAQNLSNPGITQALVSVDSLSSLMTSTAFWAVTSLSVAVCLLIALCAAQLLPLYENIDIRNILVAMGPIVVIVALSIVPQAILSRDFRFKQISFALALANVLGGIFALVLAYNDFGVWSLVGQQYVVSLVITLVLIKLSRWRPTLQFSWRSLLDLITVGGHFFGVSLIAFLNRRIDNAIVGYFFGVQALGIFVIAKKIFNVLTELLVQPFYNVSISAFSRLNANKEAVRDAYYRLVTMSSLISVPAYVGFILLSRDFVNIAFGEKWESSIDVLQIYCLAGIVQSITYFSIPVLTAAHRGGLAFRLYLSNTVGNLIAYILFVPFGLPGIGLAFSIRAVIFLPIVLNVIKQSLGMSILKLWKVVSPVYIASAVMAFLVYIFRLSVDDLPLILDFPLSILIGAISYLSVIYLINKELVKEPVTLGLKVLGR